MQTNEDLHKASADDNPNVTTNGKGNGCEQATNHTRQARMHIASEHAMP